MWRRHRQHAGRGVDEDKRSRVFAAARRARLAIGRRADPCLAQLVERFQRRSSGSARSTSPAVRSAWLTVSSHPSSGPIVAQTSRRGSQRRRDLTPNLPSNACCFQVIRADRGRLSFWAPRLPKPKVAGSRPVVRLSGRNGNGRKRPANVAVKHVGTAEGETAVASRFQRSPRDSWPIRGPIWALHDSTGSLLPGAVRAGPPGPRPSVLHVVLCSRRDPATFRSGGDTAPVHLPWVFPAKAAKSAKSARAVRL